ncbi:MAG: MmcQ/YjbR family DNA-binding protein [Frankiaceae bacterium]
MRPSDPATVERLRRLCTRLPEVTERLSHGEPTWFVRGKRSFVMLADHHHDDRFALWCAAPEGARDELVTAAPDRYFVPPYVGVRGWVGAWLDVVPVDWDEVAALVTDAYRVVAPARLVAALDAAGG